MAQDQTYRQYAIEEYVLREEPFYVPVSDEVELFEAAYARKIPALLKGPTGCGKTRFIEYMAFKLHRPLTIVREVTETDENSSSGLPLVTVACHEDLTASDLVGRYLLEG
ncbi:MAG TPA: AAA family ATPase, partial [Dehalococcoidia bacterium]|nr:AAA family ATPase [Dehalococcoidia bacterium]